MWAYRTIIGTLTRQTPFTLAFSLKVVAPSELVWLTTRIQGFKPENNEEMQVKQDDYREQMRENVINKEERIKRAMRHYYNTRAIPKN